MKYVAMLALLAFLVVPLAGCQSTEESPPPEEKAADLLDKAADEVGKAADEAAEDLEK